jgi:predicted AlkP superfamily pyrophosphatase or phosphodiesterase
MKAAKNCIFVLPKNICMKRLFPLFILAVLASSCIAIKATSSRTTEASEAYVHAQPEVIASKPKLIVGIVVDQMRYDYLVRFGNRFGPGGFNRLIENGYHLENVHFDYIPTKTAAGHASIYTGAGPSVHGVLGNDWYDKYGKRSVYCVGDDAYSAVGGPTGGKKSPHRLQTSTVSDMLKLTQNNKGKVISISLKDRGAILPGGHTADAAYWFEGNSVGRFITSTYYMNELPAWAEAYNASGRIGALLDSGCNTLYDLAPYTASMADDNPYEGLFKGKGKPTFPYDLKALRSDNDDYDLIKEVPAGNTIVTEFALEALRHEGLGKGDLIDFLALSYSSTDYVGHMFGPRSVELEDTYLRLDRELEQLLHALDQEVGKGNYSVFLTADHAVVDVPAYLQSLNIPAGYIEYDDFHAFVDRIIDERYQVNGLVADIQNEQIFLDRDRIDSLDLNFDEVVEHITLKVLEYPLVAKAFSAKTMHNTEFTEGIPALLQQGFHQKYSGDILLVLNPSTISRWSRTGTTHGAGYTYDTHVPLLFYGAGMKKGRSDQFYPITAIVPTLSSLLNITPPEGCTSHPIIEVLQD